MYLKISKIFIIALLFFSCSSTKTDPTLDNKAVYLIESYESENFKQPESILFYYFGHSELDNYFESLSKELKKSIKESSIYTEHKIELNMSNVMTINSFDEIKLIIDDNNFDAICVFHFGNTQEKRANLYNTIAQHDLFVLLVESTTNKVLMKKRFTTKSFQTILTENKTLSNAIAKELKLIR